MTETRTDRFTALRASHAKSYASVSDEVWDRDPVCRVDEHAWPCDTALALDLVEESEALARTMRGDVHHHVNPVIGWLRLAAHDAPSSFDPLRVPLAANGLPDLSGLPETVTIKTSTFLASVRQMSRATDAADAALGEGPMRDQIDKAQAEIAAAQARPAAPGSINDLRCSRCKAPTGRVCVAPSGNPANEPHHAWAACRVASENAEIG